MAGRYRFEYIRRSSDSREDDTINRVDAWVGYKINHLELVTEGIYKVADKYNLYNNSKDNYEYNFRTAYSIDAWTPFVEIGNVSVRSDSSERQTRFRVGLGYTF